MSNSSNTQSAWAQRMSLHQQFEVTAKIFRFTRPYRGAFIGALVLSALNSVIAVIMPRVIQAYIDQYLATLSANWQSAILFAAIYGLLVLLHGLTNFYSKYIYRMASERTVESIRNALFTKIQGLGMRYYDQTPAGSIVSRVTNDTETLKEFWDVFIALFDGLTNMIAVYIGMYLLDVSMAMTFLWFLPAIILIILIYQNYSSRIYRTMRETLSRVNTSLNESILGMSIIQHFRQEKRLQAEFDQENEQIYQSRRAMVQMNSLLLNPMINLLEGLALAVVIYLLGRRYFSGILPIGVIYSFTQYTDGFFAPMRIMMDNLSILQDGIVSSSRILRVLDEREFVPTQNPQPNAIISEAKVEFKDVSFSYDGEQDVLHQISFTVYPGQTVALVGQTGSGKSSIINILMRFYEFHSGQVFIDGHDIREFAYEELRDKLGLVLQDSFIFYGDVLRNIRLLDTTISRQAVQEAAHFVNADVFIEADPKGYDKEVIERGASYSGGEKQLLSFARTMVRDPKLLILDEATASIDTETETYIQDGLAKMRQGRTTIAIAHRLSTIKDADQILVLENGRIIERGNHDQLINQKGTYYQMYQLQTLEEE